MNRLSEPCQCILHIRLEPMVQSRDFRDCDRLRREHFFGDLGKGFAYALRQRFGFGA